MADPIIDSIDVNPAPPLTVAPGGTAVVTINAHHPSDGPVTVEAKVTESGGSFVVGTGTFDVHNPLTYELTAPAGYSVVQHAVPDEHIFDVTVPV